MKYTQPRTSNGRYATNRGAKRLLAIIALITGAWLAYGAYLDMSVTTTYVAEAIKPVAKAMRAPDRLDKAIEKMKRDVVLRIRDAESSGYNPKEGDLFYTHDSAKSLRAECTKTGGKRNLECESWGIMQMKIPTIQLWHKQLGKGEITEKDAMLLALDGEKAVAFAEEVIFGIKGSVWAWTTATADRTWFDYQINLIRDLESAQ